MKSKFVLFLTTIALFLTGCNSIKNENAIYAINNYDKQVISLSAKSITNMVKEKFSFNLLIYTESCSYCNTAKENIDKVQKQINYAIYELEINEGTLDYLIEELPSVFNREQIYPCLYIIDKGEVSYIAQYNELMNSSQIKKMNLTYLK